MKTQKTSRLESGATLIDADERGIVECLLEAFGSEQTGKNLIELRARFGEAAPEASRIVFQIARGPDGSVREVIATQQVEGTVS